MNTTEQKQIEKVVSRLRKDGLDVMVGVIENFIVKYEENQHKILELSEQVEKLQNQFVSIGYSNFFQLHYMQSNEFSEDDVCDSGGGMVYPNAKDDDDFKVFVDKSTWYQYQDKLKELTK